MSRNISAPLLDAMAGKIVYPAVFVDLQFRSSLQRAWTGIGSYNLLGQTYSGVGSLGKVGVVSESDSMNAAGTTVTLSGIDPVLFQDCMDDIQLGAPAKIQFALLNADATLIGIPYTIFAGQVDAPQISVGGDTLSITLALENRLVDLSRPSLTRYTSASQRLNYPTDLAFSWVEVLSDLALVWGS